MISLDFLFDFQEILSELEEISYHPNGCRLLLYLLCPRSPEHFKKSFCALLEPGDDNKHR